MLNKPKIVIIEAFWHHDVLKTLCKVMEHMNLETTVITTPKVVRRMGSKCKRLNMVIIKNTYRVKWESEKGKISNILKLFFELKKEGQHVIEIIKRINPDIVIINTLTEPAFFSPILKWCMERDKKIIVVVHNTHLWDIRWFLKNLNMKIIKERKFMEMLYNLRVAKKISGIITLGKYVKIPPRLAKKPHIVIPSRLGQDLLPPKVRNIVYFVAPGKITQRYGKDFIFIIKSFHQMLRENPSLREKIRLILLGRILDPEISKLIKEVDPQGKIIKSFSDFVDENTFSQWLTKAHYVIIPPTKKRTYGTYKISGAINDALAYGVPILLPENYAPHYRFGENVIRYSRDNFPRILASCAKCVLENYNEYKSLLDYAVAVMKDNTPENIAKKMERFIFMIS